MLEKIVKDVATDIVKHERKSKFLRPRDESASVARKTMPRRQPVKWDAAGKPLINALEHSSPHSDMIVSAVVVGFPSQAHEDFGNMQMLEAELHVVLLRQCHVGSASV